MVIEIQSRKNTTERDGGWREGGDEAISVGYSTLGILTGSFLLLDICGFIQFLLLFIYLVIYLNVPPYFTFYIGFLFLYLMSIYSSLLLLFYIML